jgi:lipopolysaccharide biosynthesis glycosyltransferase
MIPIFIGYDTRETIAYHVCANSIIRHASVPISTIPLALNLLKDYIETHTDGSNQFVYTRFLVPHLMNYQGWAIFVDGDMLVRTDIEQLWKLRDESKAVMVVKHNYQTKMKEKYLGAKNEDYPRKNWSSVILWNCGHLSNKLITPEYVQSATGPQLHRFSWLADNEIGELPIEWNWLADEFGNNQQAKLIHYTLGTPCSNEFENTTMSKYWHNELLLATFCQQINTQRENYE